MIKKCSKCGEKPAIIFVSNSTESDPIGYCLSCAKELGIKPIDSLLKNMNINEEDLENMTEQFSEMLENNEELADMVEGFEMGGAQPFPFLQNVFNESEEKNENESNEDNSKKKDKKRSSDKKEKKYKYLNSYSINLNSKAKNGELDNIIGRENELDRLVQILCRRTKNNPCLIGEPGVGKTAIAEGLAIKIVNKTAPIQLLEKQIYMLDMTSLVAGTQFRGQFESRVKGLINDIKEKGNVILFIDEVHNLVGAGDSEGSMNAANILKPALSRGQIQVIGATTLNEYRKYIEKDSALERRFQPIIVNEPSIAETVELLKGIKMYYEGFHNVIIPDYIISKIVSLSVRYINDRFLPDKAIDLMDEAASYAVLRNKYITDLYKVNQELQELKKDLENSSANENPDFEKIANIKSSIAVKESEADKLYEPASKCELTEADLTKVIEMWTGVPAKKIEENESRKLLSLKDNIKKFIVGQDNAIDKVVAAIKRSRVKLNNIEKPSSFIFVGPTGVGKTELAKVLSKELFNSDDALIRLDMSEYMEKHSVSKIIGAPPGYVGYDEAGQLTEKIRRKPYSLVLFDEIEKAHPDVLNILLQILDDGRITDASGRTVNFSNTIIIMTSNAGNDTSANPLGFSSDVQKVKEDKIIKALEEFLRPEFLGRIDEIITFNTLNKDNFAEIAKITLSNLCESLKEKGIDFKYDAEALAVYIAENSIKSKAGARAVNNFIRKNIEDKIIDLMIENSSIGSIIATLENEEITISNE